MLRNEILNLDKLSLTVKYKSESDLGKTGNKEVVEIIHAGM